MNTLSRRILGAIPVLLGISFLVFMLMHIAPGDPVSLLLGDDATPADIEQTRRELGLDQPLLVQYWDFLSRAVRGDFGRSLKFNEPVMKLVFERLPATIELAFISLVVAIIIAVPLGVYSAIKHNSLFDHAGMSVALIGVSLPNFWLGIMLIYFLGGQLNLLPVAGRIEYGIEVKPITRLYLIDSLITGNFTAFWSALQHLLMPAFTLGTSLAAIVTRISRSSVLEVMRQDFITTARAKGLSEKDGHLAAHIAQRDDHDCDHSRSPARRSAKWFCDHRNRFLISRHWRIINPIDLSPRLQANAGADFVLRDYLLRREFTDRFPL